MYVYVNKSIIQDCICGWICANLPMNVFVHNEAYLHILCMCNWKKIYIYMSVCVCVCEYVWHYMHVLCVFVYIHIYIYIFVCLFIFAHQVTVLNIDRIYMNVKIYIHIKSTDNLWCRGNTRMLASRQQTLTVCHKNMKLE